jgi:hypothetical protein
LTEQKKEEPSMDVALKPTGRRTLLQRGLALAAGALGLRAAEARSEGGAAAAFTPPPAGASFTFYGRRRPVPPSGGAHVVRSGELFERLDGPVTGAFHSNGLCLETPFGTHVRAASNIEFQTFTLAEGTLFGIGGPPGAAGGESVHAIVGGTGRFAGARGSYVERPSPTADARPGTVEFVVTLTA